MSADNTMTIRVTPEVKAKLERLADGARRRVPATYEKSVARLPYDIAYALKADTQGELVAILRVIHAARNWPTGEWPE